MSNTGAAIEDTSPHHGTRRTTAPYANGLPGTGIRVNTMSVVPLARMPDGVPPAAGGRAASLDGFRAGG